MWTAKSPGGGQDVRIPLLNWRAPCKLTAESVPTVLKLIRVVEDVGADEEVGGDHVVLVEEVVERLGRLWKKP